MVVIYRKSVSSFLSSGMRDKIDQLMISRTTQGKPTQSIYNQRQDKRQEQVTEKGRDVVASSGGAGAGGDEEYGEYFHEYEEAESSQHFTECDDFTDSTSASWSQNQNDQNQNQGGHEASECSYQAVSPSSRNIKRNSSFNARPSSIVSTTSSHKFPTV